MAGSSAPLRAGSPAAFCEAKGGKVAPDRDVKGKGGAVFERGGGRGGAKEAGESVQCMKSPIRDVEDEDRKKRR